MSLDRMFGRMEKTRNESLELRTEAANNTPDAEPRTRGRKSEFHKEHVEPFIEEFVSSLRDSQEPAMVHMRELMQTELAMLHSQLPVSEREAYTSESFTELIRDSFERGLGLFLTIDVRRRRAAGILEPKSIPEADALRYLFDASRTYVLEYRALLRACVTQELTALDAASISQYAYAIPPTVFEDLQTEYGHLDIKTSQAAFAIRSFPTQLPHRLRTVADQFGRVMEQENDDPNGFVAPSFLLQRALSHPNTFERGMRAARDLVPRTTARLWESRPRKYFPGDFLAEAVLDAYEDAYENGGETAIDERARTRYDQVVQKYADQADRYLTRTDMPYSKFPREIGTIIARRRDADLPDIFSDIEQNYLTSIAGVSSEEERWKKLRDAIRRHTSIKRGTPGHDELLMTQKILEDLVADDYKKESEAYRTIFGTGSEPGLLMQAIELMPTESTGRLSRIAEACIFEPGDVPTVRKYLASMYPRYNSEWLDELDDETKTDLVTVMTRIRSAMGK